MSTARVGDIELYYEDHGSGEPLLCIMGLAADSMAWVLQTPDFSKRYRTIIYDNRGVGRSSKPKGPYSIAQMADDAAGLLDALDIPRAHVLGVSMGGMIAQELALRHPARARTLQLHCTLGRIDPYGTLLVESLLRVRAREDREEWARAMLPWVICRKTVRERPEFVQLMLQRSLDNPYPTSYAGLRRQAEAIGGHDTLDRLHAIRVPTLVTLGAEDILVPPAFSREVHARIPGAELTVIPDAGHVHFLEQPELFNAAMLGFLKKHAGS